MFENLSDKLTAAFNKLINKGSVSEKDLDSALVEVRQALLGADVNFRVVRNFLSEVRRKAMGREIIKSLSPGQMVIKVVNDELTQLMGASHEGLNFSGPPPLVVMLVGLQGSGKTTTAAKLALYLKKRSHSPYLVPADTARPAAIEQLKILAAEAEVPVYPSTPDKSPVELSRLGVAEGVRNGADAILIDTAGRLSVDEALMEELREIKKSTRAGEILLVADAMTGQEAVTIAEDFNSALDLSGVILSKMEGDARGGAAMSMRAVIKKPLKFMGTGEKLDALEPFHPDRVASLILGMGDILTLIEKAQETVTEEEADELLVKLQNDAFTMDDLKKQFNSLKKFGTLDSILGMIPGVGRLKQLKNAKPDEVQLVKFEAMIDSMTLDEKRTPDIIDASRKRRIAKGSGTKPQEVQALIKAFNDMKKAVKQLSRGKGRLSALKGLFR
ncbi:MAG: signal recognition particle protein [Deltaproteobacteria bacterium]|jgi:signal recognition particle subunit SRP54|nr:signal recognition particle protein [Deltaproteobacteria bacterium]